MSSLFNLLTGYSAPPKWNKLIVAPLGLHEAVLGLIEREADHARAGRPARIVAKMNALVEADVIEALYRASQAGVPITLLVRGICCLRPGIPRVSETIEVRAIDRPLPRARPRRSTSSTAARKRCTSRAPTGCRATSTAASRRMIPIEDPILRARLIEILQLQIADNVKSWLLKPDGKYERVQLKPGQTPLPRPGALHRDDARSHQDRRGERHHRPVLAQPPRELAQARREVRRGAARAARRARGQEDVVVIA